MKRALLAGVYLVVLAGPAQAQISTWCVNCTTEWQEILRHAETIKHAVDQVTTLRRQLDEQIATFNAVAHLPQSELNQLAGAFSVPSIRNPLPGGDALAGIIGGARGSGGALSGVVQQFQGANRVYTPYGGDFSANAMSTNAASIAGVQAAVQQLYASAQQHSLALQTMEGQLRSAPDAKAVADIQARLALESAHLQSQQVQAEALTTWQGAQVRNTQQQREESRRCYIDAMLNGTDTTQDTCARPASQGAVQLVSAGIGGGSSLAAGYQQYAGQSVGSGQCVALVQATSDVGLTRTWTQGASVLGNTDLAVGTPIATFDASGKYANATDGSSHAAIYLGQDANGIRVMDQWLGHAASERVISTSGASQANNANAFHVIGHGTGT